MVTPYMQFINEVEVQFLTDAGIELTAAAGLGIGATQALRRAINRVPPALIKEMALAHFTPGADALFISCTALASASLIAELEDELGVPVVTSNQATFWHVLRTLGLEDQIPGYGRLLADC